VAMARVGADLIALEPDVVVIASNDHLENYRGARIIVDHYPGPVEATEALARRLLEGGTCAGCGHPVVLGPTLTTDLPVDPYR